MTQKHILGDLQLAIMHILWDQDRATVNDVHQALLAERGLAPTTIATMLKKMETKGVVDHIVDGRQFVYRPIVRQEDVTRTMVGDLVRSLYGGDALAMVNHLITERDFDVDELEALKAMIAKRDRSEGRSDVQ